jgi:hypothetical protein
VPNVFVALHTFLDPLDDAQGGLHADIAGNEHFFQIVEHGIIHGTFSRHNASQLAEEAGPRALQPLIEVLLSTAACSASFFFPKSPKNAML